MGKKAVVVGAQGVIGRYIVDDLMARDDWEVVGLSRRSASGSGRLSHVSVDLLDQTDCTAKLAKLAGVTHLFYAAFQASAGAAAGFASNIAPNLDMLINAVTAIERASPGLSRVVLVTGTKYYGVHLGPVRTPMRESDPRHMPPDFYFDQIDWLTDRQKGKAWDWVELRPQTLCGFAPGTAMSILPAIAVYAAVSKELGLPLRFPGRPRAFEAIYQVTESTHLAKAAYWAATDPRCANQAFNITNGDYFRWRNVWPRIAEVFQMPHGDVQTIALSQHMPAMAGLWQRMQERYSLVDIAFEQLAAWPFADYVFGMEWDVMSSVTKARQHGFHDVTDSEDMLVRLLQRFRTERIVP